MELQQPHPVQWGYQDEHRDTRHLDDMFARMMQATEKWEELHEYSRVAYNQQHTTLREISANLTKIQSTLTKFKNYDMAKRETYQAIECEE